LCCRQSEGKWKEAVLFLKKKNQKNFSPLGPVGRRRLSLGVDTGKWTKVFLVLFFQKKNCLPFCRLSCPSRTPTNPAVLLCRNALAPRGPAH
jgi:hypothetical protein